jgi:hypothetical protein
MPAHHRSDEHGPCAGDDHQAGKAGGDVEAVDTDQPVTIIGAMRGSVLRYDDPFAPAADPDDWHAEA